MDARVIRFTVAQARHRPVQGEQTSQVTVL